MLRTGSEEWWQTLRGPQCRAVDDAIEVTFWWRDPAGDETCSPHRRVWLYITGVTDHHQNARPQSLQRLPGTDAWFWRTTLSPTWRGSYCFIPSDRDDDFSPEVFSADAPDRALLREGWRKLLPRAIADPLNPHSWRGGRGHGVSALEMPQAPAQPGWDPLNEAHPAARCLEWRSARLGNHRRVWIYTTGEAVDPQTRPLAILLDGQFWAESMPVWSPLAALTREGRLPPAVYLLIDAIDNQRRGVELPCHRDFWLAVQEELLPLVHGYAPFSDRPDRTVVAGQSFGGLAAIQGAGLSNRFLVYSVDGSPEGKAMVSSGFLTATCAQFPSRVAEEAVKQAYAAINGGCECKEVIVTVELLTKENVEQYGLDGWQ